MNEWPTTVSLTGLVLGLCILWWRSGWKLTWLKAIGRGAYSGYHYLPWRRRKVDETLALWQSSMSLGQRMTKVHQGQVGRGLTAGEVAHLEEQLRENHRAWEYSPHLQAACIGVVKMRCVRKALEQSNPFDLAPGIVRFIAARQLPPEQ